MSLGRAGKGPPILAGLLFASAVAAACSKPEPYWIFKGYRDLVRETSQFKLGRCRREEFRGGPSLRCTKELHYRDSPDSQAVDDFFRDSPEGLTFLGSRRRDRTAIRGRLTESESWIYVNPPYLFIPRDWTPGKTWKASVREENIGVDKESGRRRRLELQSERTLKVFGRESVKLPSGTWDCLVLETTTRSRSESAVLSATMESTVRKWYSPSLGWFVKEQVSGSREMVPGKEAKSVLPEARRSEQRYSLILAESKNGDGGGGPLAGLWSPEAGATH